MIQIYDTLHFPEDHLGGMPGFDCGCKMGYRCHQLLFSNLVPVPSMAIEGTSAKSCYSRFWHGSFLHQYVLVVGYVVFLIRISLVQIYEVAWGILWSIGQAFQATWVGIVLHEAKDPHVPTHSVFWLISTKWCRNFFKSCVSNLTPGS